MEETATMGWSSRWRLGTPTTKYPCYEMLKRVMDWDGSFGMSYAMENGHQIWMLESESLFTGHNV